MAIVRRCCSCRRLASATPDVSARRAVVSAGTSASAGKVVSADDVRSPGAASAAVRSALVIRNADGLPMTLICCRDGLRCAARHGVAIIVRDIACHALRLSKKTAPAAGWTKCLPQSGYEYCVRHWRQGTLYATICRITGSRPGGFGSAAGGPPVVVGCSRSCRDAVSAAVSTGSARSAPRSRASRSPSLLRARSEEPKKSRLGGRLFGATDDALYLMSSTIQLTSFVTSSLLAFTFM